MAAQELYDYLVNGNIKNSVNLPNATLERLGKSRLCVIHRNVPNMINSILDLVSARNINVEHMLNKPRGAYAYTMMTSPKKSTARSPASSPSSPTSSASASYDQAAPDCVRRQRPPQRGGGQGAGQGPARPRCHPISLVLPKETGVAPQRKTLRVRIGAFFACFYNFSVIKSGHPVGE